jgi:hypothetical protein
MRFIQARSAPAEKLLPGRPEHDPDGGIGRQCCDGGIELADQPIVEGVVTFGPVQPEVALAPLRSISMPLMTTLPGSHAEDAEARLLDGRIESRREAEAQHPPAVGRRDDAVVPEPRAGVSRDGPGARTGRGSAP